ncbi:hypothetical protein [Klebsiella phage pKP-BM327-1.2]|nr:hypothetical protein [Klebsiella phage pKP-BM327-1.2]
MKIGCKIRSDWMKRDLYYYIKGNYIYCNDDPRIFSPVNKFITVFDESHNWYIV